MSEQQAAQRFGGPLDGNIGLLAIELTFCSLDRYIYEEQTPSQSVGHNSGKQGTDSWRYDGVSLFAVNSYLAIGMKIGMVILPALAPPTFSIEVPGSSVLTIGASAKVANVFPNIGRSRAA